MTPGLNPNVLGRPFPNAMHNIGQPVGVNQGPKIVGPVPLVFAGFSDPQGISNGALYTSNPILGDLLYETDQGIINEIQSMYFDSSACPSECYLTFLETNFTITLPGKSAGYLPIAVGQNGNYQAIITFSSGGASNIYEIDLWFMNRPVQPCVWSTMSPVLRPRTLATNAANAGNASLGIALNANAPYPPAVNPLIWGFDVTGTGATAAGSVEATLSNVLAGFAGLTTLKFEIAVPVLGQGGIDFKRWFDPPLRTQNGSHPNLTVPAMGAGQTAAAANLYWSLV